MVFKHVNWSFEARNSFFVEEGPEICLLLPTEQQEKDVVLPSFFFFLRGNYSSPKTRHALSPSFWFAFIFFSSLTSYLHSLSLSLSLISSTHAIYLHLVQTSYSQPLKLVASSSELPTKKLQPHIYKVKIGSLLTSRRSCERSFCSGFYCEYHWSLKYLQGDIR